MRCKSQNGANSFAVRLLAKPMRELGLKEGDQIDLIRDAEAVKVRRQPRSDEVLAGLQRFRGSLPASDRLNRAETHERGVR